MVPNVSPYCVAINSLWRLKVKNWSWALKTVMLATGARRGFIGLKRKYEQAAANLQAVINKLGEREIQLFFAPDIYPAGDEHVLVHEVTGRIVPEGGIPLHVGVVVANVETLVNVAYAVEGKAVTDKYVTITGAVRTPITLESSSWYESSRVNFLSGWPRLCHPMQ